MTSPNTKLAKMRSLAKSRIKFVFFGGLALLFMGGLYLFAGIRYASLCSSARPTCLDHRKAGCSISGTYDIQLGSRVIQAECDMTTDKGGWMLVANYLHRADPKPKTPIAITPLVDRLPLQAGSNLGDDETGHPTSWGHAGNLLLSALPFAEVRYRCITTAHPRLVDFAIASRQCIDYFRTGKGDCVNTPASREELMRTSRLFSPGSGLPMKAEKGWRDQGDNALVSYPFFLDWKHIWSVGTYSNRWECDDHDKPGGSTNTWHQVWIR